MKEPNKGLWNRITGGPLGGALQSQWKDTTKWLAYTLLGGLFPVWGGYLLLRLYQKAMSISDFTSNGEFAIYSAALLAPSLYLILKDYKKTNFPNQAIYGLLCSVMLIVATLIFAGVTSVNTGKVAVEIDKDFLRNGTLILFLLTLILSFFVTALDNNRVFGGDIIEVHNQDSKRLEGNFDKLEGE